MSRIELAPDIREDFDRILEHLSRHEVADAPSRIAEILQAISVLEHSPLIGRPARTDMRELIIGRQSRGYVALYRYVIEIDTVFVLAIRNQREAGYKRS
ncbi:MAG: type II toxin-antitoxin system RelE/ParE family toxin [Gammaproteobacteria bacterium]|nr:type II toxin-antitoxin system RelE/ParE family toxin [Gammaproteobacteria bacterium]